MKGAPAYNLLDASENRVESSKYASSSISSSSEYFIEFGSVLCPCRRQHGARTEYELVVDQR